MLQKRPAIGVFVVLVLFLLAVPASGLNTVLDPDGTSAFGTVLDPDGAPAFGTVLDPDGHS